MDLLAELVNCNRSLCSLFHYKIDILTIDNGCYYHTVTGAKVFCLILLIRLSFFFKIQMPAKQPSFKNGSIYLFDKWLWTSESNSACVRHVTDVPAVFLERTILPYLLSLSREVLSLFADRLRQVDFSYFFFQARNNSGKKWIERKCLAALTKKGPRKQTSQTSLVSIGRQTISIDLTLLLNSRKLLCGSFLRKQKYETLFESKHSTTGGGGDGGRQLQFLLG